MKKLILSIAAITVVGAAFASSWVPTFPDDPVVTEEEKANIAKAIPKKAFVEPKKARKILIYGATAGFRHKSIPCGKYAIDQLGEVTGAYESVVSDDPKYFEPDAIKQFDAVCLVSPTQDMFLPQKGKKGKETAWSSMSEEEQAFLVARHKRLTQSLVEYVKAGGGLMGIHAASDACYGDPGYGEMVGGYFAGHPWTAQSLVHIVVEDPEHKLNKLVFTEPDFKIQDEIYQYGSEPYSREKCRVLLHLDPAKSGETKKPPSREDNDYPVAWVKKWGKGRVFYSNLGHNNSTFWNPLAMKHFLAGLQYAVGDIKADTKSSAQVGQWGTSKR